MVSLFKALVMVLCASARDAVEFAVEVTGVDVRFVVVVLLSSAVGVGFVTLDWLLGGGVFDVVDGYMFVDVVWEDELVFVLF